MAADDKDDGFAHRNAASFLEKFERYESQELLACSASHWMLSGEDFKLPTEPASGIISNMAPINGFTFMFLMPEQEDLPPLDLREVHQIIRELTFGIYALNQVPNIALEANFDQSTTCQLPPAYQDTRVGQIMINVDYMLKALWHGAYFPKEKRTKFADRWRGNLDVNVNSGKPETKKPLLTEFTSAGMLDVSKDPDYANAYDKLAVEDAGDQEMAEERKFFMSHVDDLSMQMTFFQKSMVQHKHLFVVDADWNVSSIGRILDDKIDHSGYERINARLQLHEIMLKENLPNKLEIKKDIYLLKLVAFLVPLLIGMKKRMKVPDLTHMLPNMSGDDVKTERELPPLILSQDHRCKNFNFGNQYFHLHGGILIDLETDNPVAPPMSMVNGYADLMMETSQQLNRFLDPSQPLHEGFPIPVKEFDGKRYHAFAVDFETYYSQSPQKPKWVQVLCDELSNLRYKRLPMQEMQLHELFKKYFGYKRAIKYKNVPNGLKAASSRGLIATFMTLCRKCPPSRLGKQDEVGLTVMHHAAIYNRPQIIAILILQSMDVNVRRSNHFLSQAYVPSHMRTGPTPLHLASRCGSLDAAACLVANYANLLAVDEEGWAPIHHASYFDHEQIIKLLARKNDALLELQAKNNLRSTPVLLAASAGAMSSLRCLVDLGSYVLRKDDEGNGVIQLAALRFHTNILEFFIQWNNPDVPVWALLVGMLKDENMKKKDSAVKCLEVMSTSEPGHWEPILQADGVPALVDLLKLDNDEIRSVACSVLCNISEHDPIRRALTKADAGPILIQLLSSHVDEIQSRAAIVLSDLASIDDNQSLLAEQGIIAPLVNLLESELEDVLVNAVNCMRVLCRDNHANQTAIADEQGIEPLVEFLTVNSDILQSSAAAAIASLISCNKKNQDRVVAEGAVEPLVSLIKGRNITVQVKAAMALEALADKNPEGQQAFMTLDAPSYLMRLFRKVWSLEVKEQTACAVWALAGHTLTQEKYIAERIGIPQLTDMLLAASEKLQYVGCMGMTALGQEDMENQNRIAEQDGLKPLVRLLRQPKTSDKVLLAVIKTLGTLCIGVAHKSNRVTQRKIAIEERAIPFLVQLFVEPPSVEIQVEVAYTLGCVVLSSPENQERLREEPLFKYDILLDLLLSDDENLRLKAGFALSIFAFNNTPQQFSIREAGGIKFNCFKSFLESDDPYCQCNAAFQIIVLARVIVDKDQVSLTAMGVTKLVEILKSTNDDAVILTSSLMSSLAHTRAGIPDAMLTVGAIELLTQKLYSDNDQVRFAAAVALGYLTFNRASCRRLLVACRNTPGLFDKLMKNIGTKPKICKDFTEEFKTQQVIGLPCLSLEINGGPPVDIHSKRAASVKRPKTTQSMAARRNKENAEFPERAISAPAIIQRARSAGGTRLRPMPERKEPQLQLSRNSSAKAADTGSSFMKSKLSSWDQKKSSRPGTSILKH